jgi:hypothetical protein
MHLALRFAGKGTNRRVDLTCFVVSTNKKIVLTTVLDIGTTMSKHAPPQCQYIATEEASSRLFINNIGPVEKVLDMLCQKFKLGAANETKMKI